MSPSAPQRSPPEGGAAASAAAPGEPSPSAPDKDRKSAAGIKDGEVMVVIERSVNDTIGLHMDLTDGLSLVVADIVAGVVQTWNDARAIDERLRVHDRIVEVNGARGSVEVLMSALKRHKVWNLIVQKPTPIRLEVEQSSTGGLGVDLRYAPNGESLVISTIEEGPIKRWGDAHPESKIKVNDRVSEVNACRGDAQTLLRAFPDQAKVSLEVLLYPPL